MPVDPKNLFDLDDEFTVPIFNRPADDRVAQLEAGLRQAKDKLLEQQVQLIKTSGQLARFSLAPYIIGTVLQVLKRKFHPLPGLLVKGVQGEAKDRLLEIGHVGPNGVLCVDIGLANSLTRDPMARLARGLAGPDPQSLTVHLAWDKHWSEVFRPADAKAEILVATVALGNGTMIEVAAPSDMKLRQGQRVKLESKTLQIVGLIKEVFGGELVTVSSVIDRKMCEVELRGEARAVVMGRFAKRIAAGTRVQLDDSGTIVVAVHTSERSRFDRNQPATAVSWSDIGGQDEAIQALREAILLPHEEPALYRHYAMTPPKGVLLYGPPGCGKTTLAKATATEIARLHGKGGSGGFVYVKGSEILDKWLGNSEAVVRKVFVQARDFKKKHGFPAVICFDEAEAVMRRRGMSDGSHFLDTLVPAFLAEMDGMEESGAIVMLLTNRPDMLDPAITRDGRVDRKIQVKRPNRAEVAQIFQVHLRDLPFAKDCTLESLAESAADSLFSDGHLLHTVATNAGEFPFTLKGLRSGALVEGIAKAARAAAFKRDRAAGAVTGLAACDIESGIAEKLRENRDLRHPEAVLEFLEEFGRELVPLDKASDSSQIQ